MDEQMHRFAIIHHKTSSTLEKKIPQAWHFILIEQMITWHGHGYFQTFAVWNLLLLIERCIENFVISRLQQQQRIAHFCRYFHFFLVCARIFFKTFVISYLVFFSAFFFSFCYFLDLFIGHVIVINFIHFDWFICVSLMKRNE